MPAPTAAPTIVATDPEVVDKAFAATRSAACTTCGSAADRAARNKRLTPRAATAVTKKIAPAESASTRPATTTTSATLTVLAMTSTSCRRQRSKNTPANGPAIEYGSSKTANAAAIFAGVVAFSGENTTWLA